MSHRRVRIWPAFAEEWQWVDDGEEQQESNPEPARGAAPLPLFDRGAE